MFQSRHYSLQNEQEMILFAQGIARVYQENVTSSQSLVVYLQGDLGVGKSFFSRAFIQFFLPDQKVKSPTYTIVESYQTPLTTIHHFDLYRLCDPEELEYLAIRDLLTEHFVALIEWPQKGEGVLPSADIVIELQHPLDVGEETADELSDQVRLAEISAKSNVGEQLVEKMVLAMSKK